MFDLSYQAEKAIKLLTESGYEAYIVGGCVRDFLMNKTPDDVDITTSAEPYETERVFSASGFRIFRTGIKHGTVTAVIDGQPLEITTYRTDGKYSDNRHPDNVLFTKSLKEDMARRDFTMNSIAYSPKDGVIDYFKGTADIKNKIIRCVGNPDLRFSEDALRILRAVRFASVLGFSIEEDTKQAIFRNMDRLKNISAERIFSELCKLLCGTGVKDVIMQYSEILEVIIPELRPMRDFEQKTKYHIYNVLEHTAYVVSSIEPKNQLRLAALLHDIGKPDSFSEDEKGRGHFYGHGAKSEELARSILNSLRCSNQMKDNILKLIRYHDEPIAFTPRSIKKYLGILGEDLFFDLLKLKKADDMSKNPEFSRVHYFEKVERLANEILSSKQCFLVKDLRINGRDLIAIGVSQGRDIGRILDDVLGLVIDDKLENDKQVLLEYIKTNYELNM